MKPGDKIEFKPPVGAWRIGIVESASVKRVTVISGEDKFNVARSDVREIAAPEWTMKPDNGYLKIFKGTSMVACFVGAYVVEAETALNALKGMK